MPGSREWVVVVQSGQPSGRGPRGGDPEDMTAGAGDDALPRDEVAYRFMKRGMSRC